MREWEDRTRGGLVWEAVRWFLDERICSMCMLNSSNLAFVRGYLVDSRGGVRGWCVLMWHVWAAHGAASRVHYYLFAAVLPEGKARQGKARQGKASGKASLNLGLGSCHLCTACARIYLSRTIVLRSDVARWRGISSGWLACGRLRMLS